MTTHPANAAFHAVQAVTQAAVRAPEPTEAELLEELEYQLSDAEFRREVAERKSDPFMRQRELDRWSHRIMHINAQIKVLKGGM